MRTASLKLLLLKHAPRSTLQPLFHTLQRALKDLRIVGINRPPDKVVTHTARWAMATEVILRAPRARAQGACLL
jgi:hypothetical protein